MYSLRPVSRASRLNIGRASPLGVSAGRANYATTTRNPYKTFKHEPFYQSESITNRAKNANLVRLVDAYRRYGHYNADLDPLGLGIRNKVPQLDTLQYGLQDPAATFDTRGIMNMGGENTSATLTQIQKQLEKAYCSKIGVQLSFIENEAEREWLYNEVEAATEQHLTKEEKLHINRTLARSEAFDHFMHKRFPAVKRYGLEGNESMMALMDEIFSEGAKAGVEDVVIGMPHRGRLNLLVDLLDFPARNIFYKVTGQSELPSDVIGSGDVLSHLGTSITLKNYKNPVHVSLIHNPSHLEAVNPVAMGKIRAKQAHKEDTNGGKSLCVLLHGDAAFAGQGIVAESLALAHLPGFSIGGTVHVIVNNQLGFTTSPHLGRSTHYSADMAKMVGCPIIHVNADSPEDVVKATRIAMSYRQKFKRDLVIDLIGYRRHGHNEVDEPAFTQPIMYRIVRARPSVSGLYAKQLMAEGILTQEESTKIVEDEMHRLDHEMKATSSHAATAEHLTGKWKGMVQSATAVVSPDTGVNVETLKEIALKSVEHPNIAVHARLERAHCQSRLDKINKNMPVDWPTAEALAVGSLLREGHNVRLSGQDVGRGTFSQRHFELIDQNNEVVHLPLNHLSESQGKLEVVNSNLSEFAVLCYEYGYSIEDPKNLIMWEAQFGDFANGAQISIDQFVTSGEAKWLRQSGITMLLPHGYDGTGPEHSSARIERFLQLTDVEGVNVHSKEAFAANPNFHVINASTPANYFHAIRRQQIRNFRKPLVVVSPKILLRHPAAVSPLTDMQEGTHFKPVLLDDDSIKPETVERLVFCSGKIYYDLVEERKKRNMLNTAFVRLEELSPFPFEGVQHAMRTYSNAKKFLWVQEESQNAGAWSYIEPRFGHFMQQANSKLIYVGRPPLAACAVGVSAWHKKESAALFNDAFQK